MKRTILLLIASVLILVTVGVVMLASASMIKGAAEEQFRNDPAYFVKRQGLWMALALTGAFVCAKIDLHRLQQLALPAAGFSLLLLILVRIPGIGLNINGSWRWLRFGPVTVQPSELAKIGLILVTAWWIARRRRALHTLSRGVLVPIAGLSVFAGLLLIEPDFGTAMLFGAVVITLLYLGGAAPRHLLGFLAAGGGIVALMLLRNANRMRRIIAFLDPEKYARQEAWQLVNALEAFAAGGPYGAGLGNSIQKYHYLPEAHTDFILPIIGEEFGLPATLSILLLFAVVFICGLHIAARASDDFGRFAALGITLMLTFQALINIAVVTGSMPTKGLALPFISYGGSSLMVSSAMIGLLVNIAHTARDPRARRRTALFKDGVRRA